MSEPNRSRILLVTRNLPPLVGGMERLNWHMAEELARVADVRVIGPAGSATLAPAGVNVREAPVKPLWKFLWRARQLVRHEARTWRPNVVLAGSGLTAPLARSAARQCGARTCVYAHGLDIAVAHPVYRALWLPAIRAADRVIANSHPTAALCRRAGVADDRIGIVHPGVDLPSIPEPRNAAADFRRNHGLGDKPLLLSVGRLSTRKGLREFVGQALPRIVAVRPNVLLLIVGDAPVQALHAQVQTRASIQAAADAAGLGGHLRFLGKIPDHDLEAAYCAANVHIFPVREIADDPEGFGMVAIEAAAHGLPTVAFAVGGVVDAVSQGESGHLVQAGEYTRFADSVIATLDQREELRDRCHAFVRRFAWPEFGHAITQQLARIGVCADVVPR